MAEPLIVFDPKPIEPIVSSLETHNGQSQTYSLGRTLVLNLKQLMVENSENCQFENS